MHIIAVDIETTGVDPRAHEIWEVGLAWVGPDGRLVVCSSLVRPSPDATWSDRARELAAGVDLAAAPELADVCAALGVAPPSPAHRAAPDARACLQVLLELRRRVGVAP